MALFLIALIIPLLVAMWVASDAKKRGCTTGTVIGWFMGVFFLLIVFLPLYLILRSRRPRYSGQTDITKVCPYCGRLFKEDPNFCPYCGEKLR